MFSSICKFIFIISFTLFTILITVTADNVSVTTDFQSIIQGWITAADKGPDPLCSSGTIDVATQRSSADLDASPHHDGTGGKTPTGGGNCTNNLTVPHGITRPPLDVDEPIPADPSVVTSDDVSSGGRGGDDVQKQPIATFDEWTKEKLKQGERKAAAAPSISPSSANHGGPSAVPIVAAPAATARNYASRECGAKVLMSNPEAENTKALLNDKEKDEYMRNPCSKAENKFVVIELCETIQPRRIELGNFELFSSGPKEVRVWAAERYPNGEWQLVGEFAAADSRNVQSFVMTNSVYAKFVKLELISHHGSEHYCTLSMLKVLGMSMVDEYEIEAEAAVRLPVAAAVSDVPTQTVAVPAEEPQPTFVEPSEYPANQDGQTTTPYPVTASQIESPPVVSEEPPKKAAETEEPISGGILTKIVSVVKDITGQPEQPKPQPRIRRRSFDMSLCRVCPVSATCIVPTHLCWVFVWRPPTKPASIPLPSNLTSHLRRSISDRLRRRRIAYLQRMTANYRKGLAAAEAGKVAKPTGDAAVVEDATTMPPTVSPQAASPPSSEPATTIPIEPQQSPPSDPVKVVSKSTPAPPSAVPSESLPAASVSHKESVFMKLNKRIAALELNMSLSSEYLSELSRQYVAQTDEHKKHLEQARRTAQEVAHGVESRLNEIISEKLSSMRNEMDSLSAWLSSMRVAATEVSLTRHRRTTKRGDEAADEQPVGVDDAEEECPSPDAAYLKHYAGANDDDTDGMWTTEQVIYAVIAAQATTVILMGGLLCYSWMSGRTAAAAVHVDPADLDTLVREKVEQALQQMKEPVQQQPHHPEENKKKKKKRRKRGGGVAVLPETDRVPSGAPSTSDGWPDNNSTVSSRMGTTTATETSSDAESGRGLAVTPRHSPPRRFSPASELESPKWQTVAVRS